MSGQLHTLATLALRKGPLYLLSRRMSEPHIQTERYGEKIHLWHLPVIETPSLCPPVRSPFAVQFTINQLHLTLHTFGLDLQVCTRLSTVAVSRTVTADETIFLNSRLHFWFAVRDNFGYWIIYFWPCYNVCYSYVQWKTTKLSYDRVSVKVVPFLANPNYCYSLGPDSNMIFRNEFVAGGIGVCEV